MKSMISLAATLAATPALAHVGHLAEVAGHGHWLGAAAAGAAVAIALWAGLKGKTWETPEAEGDDTPNEEPQEA